MYPPEQVERQRFQKIAKALGTRTTQQVGVWRVPPSRLVCGEYHPAGWCVESTTQQVGVWRVPPSRLVCGEYHPAGWCVESTTQQVGVWRVPPSRLVCGEGEGGQRRLDLMS